MSEFKQHVVSVVEGKASTRIPLVVGVHTLFIELCALTIRELTEQVPYRSAAFHFTDQEYRTCSIVEKTIISILCKSVTTYMSNLYLGIYSLNFWLPLATC